MQNRGHMTLVECNYTWHGPYLYAGQAVPEEMMGKTVIVGIAAGIAIDVAIIIGVAIGTVDAYGASVAGDGIPIVSLL